MKSQQREKSTRGSVILREGELDKALGRTSCSSLDGAAFPDFRKTHRGYLGNPRDARIEEWNYRYVS